MVPKLINSKDLATVVAQHHPQEKPQTKFALNPRPRLHPGRIMPLLCVYTHIYIYTHEAPAPATRAPHEDRAGDAKLLRFAVRHSMALELVRVADLSCTLSCGAGSGDLEAQNQSHIMSLEAPVCSDEALPAGGTPGGFVF